MCVSNAGCQINVLSSALSVEFGSTASRSIYPLNMALCHTFPAVQKPVFCLSLSDRRRIYLRLPVSRIYGCARAKFHRNSLHC